MKPFWCVLFSALLSFGAHALPLAQRKDVKCTKPKQCPVSDFKSPCNDGKWPDQDIPTCIDGICGIIERCSQITAPIKPLKPNACFGPDCARPTCVNDKCAIINPCSLRKQCTVRNTTQCFASFVCARCLPGYSPPCTEVYCVNGNCKVVGPCSIFTSTTKVTTMNPNCKSNVECPVPVDCRKKCPQGYGPLCASAKCSDGKCVAIDPCSIAEECLPTNLSSCPIPKICALCKTGYEPPCATASCIDGKCHIVQPCSIFKPPKQSCEKDTDCKFTNTCVERCDDKYSLPCTTATCNKTECVIHPPCSIRRYCTEDDVSQCRIPIKCSHCLLGYSPSCTRITCVNRQCKAIEPCSILTTTVKSTLVSAKILVCRNDSDCKANEMNCTECMKGFGPSCEYATCQNNLCIQIKPCSKKLDRS